MKLVIFVFAWKLFVSTLSSVRYLVVDHTITDSLAGLLFRAGTSYVARFLFTSTEFTKANILSM